MECYAARLASFNATHVATKKRPSDPKGTRALKWPHRNPSPPQLAHAGFYYQPTSSCPDNVTCYLCRSKLDGWEETDDPIDEHLSHSGSCGWAISAFAERAIENGHRDLADPLSEGMLEARRMTFAAGWPHENKRGWLCKIQKMIEAGWHYCPTEESDDFVRCSYCSLSLDGWEPKDNPYEEHQRRSPDCMVFKSVDAAKPKSVKGRKARSSKASRLSSMSSATVASETLSVDDAEAAIDESMVSTATVSKQTKRKGGKKAAKVKKSTTRGKVLEKVAVEPTMASRYIEPEDDDFSVKVDQSPEPITKGRKRKSNQISATDNNEVERKEDPVSQGPPAKRKATRNRNSVAVRPNDAGIAQSEQKDEDVEMGDLKAARTGPSTKKDRKGGKKRASSTTRKASMMSTASKASLRAGDSGEDDLEAALELDLDRPLTDEERDVDLAEGPKPKGRRLTRTKPGSKKVTASVAPTRKQTRASTLPLNEPVAVMDRDPDPPSDSGIQNSAENNLELGRTPKDYADENPYEDDKVGKLGNRKPPAKRKAPIVEEESNQEVDEAYSPPRSEPSEPAPSKRQPTSRQASRQLPARTTRISVSSAAQYADAPNLDSSTFDAHLLADDSGHETDTSVAAHGRGGRKGPKKSITTKKGRKGKKAQTASRNIEDIVQPTFNETINGTGTTEAVTDRQEADEAVQLNFHEHGTSTEEHPVKVKQNSKSNKTEFKSGKGRKGTSKAKAPAKEPSPEPSEAEAPPSPTAPEVQPTPAASPQSSDAENQPPSSRPSQLRPPLTVQSPPRLQATLIPLALSTPTRSPSKNTFSKLQTAVPWTAVDLERIFQGTPNAGKENDPFAFGVDAIKGSLTSPEKRLTVEQWIHFNAQRGEEKLRAECERMVGKFEGEGMRALRTLEGIECAD